MRRKSATGILAILIALFIIIASLVGCTGGKEADGPNDGTEPKEGTEDHAEDKDPNAKYDPPIKITMSGDDKSKVVPFKDGDNVRNTPQIRGYKEELGIELDFMWLISNQDELSQKISIGMASKQLPDIIPIEDPIQMVQLQSSGMIHELSEVIEEYASPKVKELLFSKEQLIESAKVKGGLYSVPNLINPPDYGTLMWIRTDWLENLNLPEPETMEDVIKIAEAFAKNDPDGNGQDDTFALGLTKELYENAYSMAGFANGFHAYPNMWIEADDGSLVYGSIQPEMKNVLQALQDLYRNGAIDPEFGVKGGSNVLDDTTAGRIGIEFGAWWNGFWPLPTSVQNNPDADWKAFPLMSIDDKPAQPAGKVGALVHYVVTKNCKNPEALVKMANFWAEVRFTKDPDIVDKYATDAEGGKMYDDLWPVWLANPDENYNAYTNIKEALETKDTSKLDIGYEMPIYEKIVKFQEGDATFWGDMRNFGPGGSVETMMEMDSKAGFVNDSFYGSPTETMKTKWSTLQDEELKVFTKIILGAPIDDFDGFVDNWLKMGGEQITNEVNEWNKTK